MANRLRASQSARAKSTILLCGIQLFRQRLSHISIKANTTMPISIMGIVVIVLFSLSEVNSVSQRKSIKHVFVLFRSVMMKCF